MQISNQIDLQELEDTFRRNCRNEILNCIEYDDLIHVTRIIDDPLYSQTRRMFFQIDEQNQHENI